MRRPACRSLRAAMTCALAVHPSASPENLQDREARAGCKFDRSLRERPILQNVIDVAPEVLDDLVAANRILADQGILDAFGHVSIRHPDNPAHYLMSRWLAPALVTAQDIVEYDLESVALTHPGLRLYS